MVDHYNLLFLNYFQHKIISCWLEKQSLINDLTKNMFIYFLSKYFCWKKYSDQMMIVKNVDVRVEIIVSLWRMLIIEDCKAKDRFLMV